jgi:hypothetical protein
VIQSSNLLETIFQSPQAENYFCGYYQHSPLNSTGRYLICIKIYFYGREISSEDTAEIGYFDLESLQWFKVANTRALNWQQGCMLQWIGPDFDDTFIFNDFNGEKYISRIYSINNKSIVNLDFPIYALHPSGSYALTFNFERYNFCRAYSYYQLSNDYWNGNVHSEDGIYKVDLKNHKRTKVISIDDVLLINTEDIERAAFHWLEQADWNSDGSSFRFIHRFSIGNEYKTRVFISNETGEILKCLNGTNEWNYTHGAWRGNQEWVVFASKTTKLGTKYNDIINNKSFFLSLIIDIFRGIKKYLPKRFVQYHAINSGYKLIKNGLELDFFNKSMLYEDGHPSWTKDGRYMLSDTYSDKNMMRHLYLFDSQKGMVIKLESFFSPINNTNYRCDLHPRFSFDDSMIVIDSAHNGFRQVLIFKVNWIKIKELI